MPTPMRLPPLKTLRVRNPHQRTEQPCMTNLASVLSCWASIGYNSQGCAAVEMALRECMDAPKPVPRPPSTINFHLMRFQKRLTGYMGPKGSTKKTAA